MRYFISALALLVAAELAGVFDFIAHVLNSIWPLVAAAAGLAALAAGIAIGVYVIGLALRSVRPEQVVEVIPAGSLTFERRVPTVELKASLDDWMGGVLRFALIGNLTGFSFRRMEGIVTRTGWEALAGLLVVAGVLVTGKTGTRWADGWSYGRLKMELKYNRLSLPYPSSVPPRVLWLRPNETRTPYTSHTPCTSDTPHEISDGVWVG